MKRSARSENRLAFETEIKDINSDLKQKKHFQLLIYGFLFTIFKVER